MFAWFVELNDDMLDHAFNPCCLLTAPFAGGQPPAVSLTYLTRCFSTRVIHSSNISHILYLSTIRGGEGEDLK